MLAYACAVLAGYAPANASARNHPRGTSASVWRPGVCGEACLCVCVGVKGGAACILASVASRIPVGPEPCRDLVRRLSACSTRWYVARSPLSSVARSLCDRARASGRHGRQRCPVPPVRIDGLRVAPAEHARSGRSCRAFSRIGGGRALRPMTAGGAGLSASMCGGSTLCSCCRAAPGAHRGRCLAHRALVVGLRLSGHHLGRSGPGVFLSAYCSM